MISLESYNFELPPHLLANTPAEPRDSARLFVYDCASDTVTCSTFSRLAEFLPTGSHLVMNDTKVLPARLWLRKEMGGKIEVLLAVNELQKDSRTVRGLVDRKISIGAKLFFQNGAYLEVITQQDQFFVFHVSGGIASLESLLMNEGHTPIPPYIKHTSLSESELRKRYQTIFATTGSSVAAPTASLHFTADTFATLERAGIQKSFVRLEVGAGTFAPIGEKELKEKKLFTEFCAIDESSADAINRALASSQPVIPVGTTTMRTLETFALQNGQVPRIKSGNLGTNIFIFPPYQFKVASGLITNFHVPKSSLLLLVDALLEHKQAKRRILDLYRIAIEKQFRFYSFGDSMLIR